MPSHFVSLNRGEEGQTYSDFTVGTSSTATDVFEFRILDGQSVRTIEVIKVLEALEHYFENAQLVKAGAFDIVP